MCWCEAFVDISTELNEYADSLITLKAYYQSKAAIDKQLENASEEEAATLNGQLEALKTEYRDQLDVLKTKQEALSKAYEEKAGQNAFAATQAITINGKTAEKNNKSVIFNSYDFGKAAEKPAEEQSFIDMIKAFFSNIIEFFKNLFSNIFSR